MREEEERGRNNKESLLVCLGWREGQGKGNMGMK